MCWWVKRPESLLFGGSIRPAKSIDPAFRHFVVVDGGEVVFIGTGHHFVIPRALDTDGDMHPPTIALQAFQEGNFIVTFNDYNILLKALLTDEPGNLLF
jgi:hypothetical protein